jgi:hypothetical protein
MLLVERYWKYSTVFQNWTMMPYFTEHLSSSVVYYNPLLSLAATPSLRGNSALDFAVSSARSFERLLLVGHKKPNVRSDVMCCGKKPLIFSVTCCLRRLHLHEDTQNAFVGPHCNGAGWSSFEKTASC